MLALAGPWLSGRMPRDSSKWATPTACLPIAQVVSGNKIADVEGPDDVRIELVQPFLSRFSAKRTIP